MNMYIRNMRNNIESNPPTLLIIYILESEADIMLDVLVAEIISNITNEINIVVVYSIFVFIDLDIWFVWLLQFARNTKFIVYFVKVCA